jgi:hypothetical protein
MRFASLIVLDRSRADVDDVERTASRPTATYAAAICYVRFTSIRAQNPFAQPTTLMAISTDLKGTI